MRRTVLLLVAQTASTLGSAQSSFWTALRQTTLQREIAPTILSRVAAYSEVGSLVLAPVGLAAAGVAAAAFRVAPVLGPGAAWTIVSTAALLGTAANPGRETVEAAPSPA